MLVNLREIRIKRGLSQKELAELIHVSRSNYSYYENGQRWPNEETLIAISKALDVSVDYLLGLVENPVPYRQMSEQEEHNLRKYRELDDRGRTTIDQMMVFEQLRYPSDLGSEIPAEAPETGRPSPGKRK